jgi:dienelactone hydrolase
MALKTENIVYQDDNVILEGYLALPEKLAPKNPAVLVVHDWSGRNEFAVKKAEKLAELGYIAFAVDMYGKDKRGQTKEEKSALMQPLMADRLLLQKRILAAFTTVKKLANVDTNRIGAIGFCFGGLCALDLARSGAEVKAVVSFHGLLHAPENIPSHSIKANILALHGYDDPMGTPETVIAFCNEMTLAKANWQLDMYGNTVHAFTNPQANDPDFGTVYNKQADNRSWIAMQEFFKEGL